MCCLKSLTFIGLMALVAAQDTVAPPVAQPSNQFPVAPTICGVPSAPGAGAGAGADVQVPQVAPIRPDQRILPYLGGQYWPGYGANSWYGYRPYWGGYQQPIPRTWVPRLRSRPVVLPFEAVTVPAVEDIEAVTETVEVPAAELP